MPLASGYLRAWKLLLYPSVNARLLPPKRNPVAAAGTSGRRGRQRDAGTGRRAGRLGMAAYRLRSGPDVRTSVRRQGRAGSRAMRQNTFTPETELVVYSDAVPPTNPELRRAAELGIPALSYFQMLGRLTADRHTVAMAGTHGKSTTTAMAAHILVEAGCDPTVFCGATPLGATSGGRADADGSPLPLGEGQGVRASCATWRSATGPHPNPLPKGEGTACWSRRASIGPISCTSGRGTPPSWASSPTISTATTRWTNSNGPSDSSPPRCRRTDCCWCGTIVHRPAGRRPACRAGWSRSDCAPRPIGRPM